MTNVISQLQSTALIKSYLDELSLRDELSYSTISKYRQCISAYLDWLGEQDISERTARLFLSYLRERNYSSSTRRLYYAALKPFLHFLGIYIKIKFPRHHHLPAYHSSSDISSLLSAISSRTDNWSHLTSERDRLIILLFAFTGIRRSELLNLRFIDVNFHSRCIYIRNGKGDKDRVIPMASTIYQPLNDYICYSSFRSHDRLFPLQPRRIYTIVKRYANLAVIPDFSPHDLRHYFATSLLEQGASIRAIQELLGHADISTTAIYLDLVPQHLASAIELLDGKDILHATHR